MRLMSFNGLSVAWVILSGTRVPVPGFAEFIYIIGNSFEDEHFDNYALCLEVDWCLLYGQLSNRQVASTRFWWIYLHRSIRTKTIHVCPSIMVSVDVKHRVY